MILCLYVLHFQTRTAEELIENNSVENHPSEVSNMEPIREVTTNIISFYDPYIS